MYSASRFPPDTDLHRTSRGNLFRVVCCVSGHTPPGGIAVIFGAGAGDSQQILLVARNGTMSGITPLASLVEAEGWDRSLESRSEGRIQVLPVR